MELFIRRLPEATTRLDLIKYVSDALKPRWHLLQFAPTGSITESEILRIEDTDHESIEFHGVIHIVPAAAALTALERLDGNYFKSKKVEVRKYFHRSTERDRRHRQSASPANDIQEQRKQDRRRIHLLIEPFHAGATSRKPTVRIAASAML